MTTKNTIQLLENALQIAKTFNLKLKDNNNNYQYVELKSIYNSLFEALKMDAFKRVKKQLNNCINTIKYAVENDLISFNDYVYINYTKNYINRGVLVSSVLKEYTYYFESINRKMNIHLVDTNNAISVKKQTTNENSITVCDSGIYFTKTSDFNFHYDLTSDKNKKIVKKLTEIKNDCECIVAW
jgi:hypothetical protein